MISIHASRMGGDRRLLAGGHLQDISIHASRMGGDELRQAFLDDFGLFQSTPPGWEATTIIEILPIHRVISIHASRMGGDRAGVLHQVHTRHFNPRLPDGRRRAWGEIQAKFFNFNPRLPDGRRPPFSTICATESAFQSTPPGWEATGHHHRRQR